MEGVTNAVSCFIFLLPNPQPHWNIPSKRAGGLSVLFTAVVPLIDQWCLEEPRDLAIDPFLDLLRVVTVPAGQSWKNRASARLTDWNFMTRLNRQAGRKMS